MLKKPLNSALFIVASLILVSCSNKNEDLTNDSLRFCDVFTIENWDNYESGITPSELEETVSKKSKEAVKTEEFTSLIDDLNAIEFYHDLYPTAKARIEALTGKEWECPQYQKFYDLKLEKGASKATDTVDRITILVTATGDYYYQDENLDFNSPVINSKELNDTLIDNKNVKVILEMQPGAKDEYLEPIFKYLASMSISTVQVISN